MAHERRVATPRDRLLVKSFWRVLDPLARALLLVWCIAKFDVFIFSYGTSFFAQREFPLLRSLNKIIVCVFYGSDERPHYLSGVSAELPYEIDAEWYRQRSIEQKNMLSRVAQLADYIVSHPLSSQFQQRAALSFMMLGLPQSSPLPVDTGKREQWSRVRALHAPSRPISKGTAQIREIIAKLRSEGIDIDYVEITGRPHAEVLEEIARCDFVIDEVWSDSPLAMFAAEAAAAGKPTIVGGYGWDVLQKFSGGLPPSLACHPDELEMGVRRLATDSAFRRDLGSRAHEFVAAEWSSRRVAERYLKVLSDGGEQSWYFDPYQVNYAFGYGMPIDKVGATARMVIDDAGVESLQLNDKPELLESILSLAGLRSVA
jgi:hypothetical protein